MEFDEFEEDLAQRELERLKDENADLRRRLNRIRREDDTAEKVREKIMEIAAISPDPPSWLYEPTSASVPGVPSVLWSDWHWGEDVSREQVGGVNEYNTDIANERGRKLVEKTIELATQHMVNPEYPGLVVNIAGDLFSGDIHEELADTNDRYTLQTFNDLFDFLCWAFPALLEHFPRLFVPMVPGNHDRTTLKPRNKGRVFTSLEWLLACMLERHFKDEPRIQFLIPNEADAFYSIYGHRYMLTHGDSLGVKGGDGIIGSLGPIMRGAMKVGRSEAQIGRQFDTLLMGHWHQMLWLPGVIVNGTMKGYDEYARLTLRAMHEPPIQALWYTHERYGKTAYWPVYLEEKATARGEWVSWSR